MLTLRLLLLLLAALPAAAPARLAALTITEVMYHPRGGGRALEYIELHNETADPLDLAGYRFTRGVHFVFTERVFLDPGAYLVVCADEARLRAEHAILDAAGDWDPGTSLENGGETIEITDAAGVVEARVAYDDQSPWPSAADGTGHSLELEDPLADPAAPGSWRRSRELGGSPGRANGPPEAPFPVVFNEALLLTSGARWVELYNRGDEALDLSGFHLSTARDDLSVAALPAGTRLGSGERISFEDGALGLDLAPVRGGGDRPRLFVALSVPGGERVATAHLFEPRFEERSEARVPDGARAWSADAEPTRDAPNRGPATAPVVINEILYHPIDEDPAAEFVELHNLGADPVPLGGWRFTDGIRFELPPAVSIAPGGYLVVARDPEAIARRHALAPSSVVGPLTEDARAAFGLLSDRGERLTLEDPRGNVVDTLEYADGGEWPRWADGGGSSLELIDPFQDNAVGQAWDASDDAARAATGEFAASGRFHGGPGSESELHLLLAGRGIALVDDLELRERSLAVDGASALIDAAAPWAYLPGRSEPPASWRRADFDDSAWARGAPAFGYGEGDETTPLGDMRGSHVAVYFRREFLVDDPSVFALAGSPRDLILEIEYDDGFAAYLNGEEVAARNLPAGARAFDAVAPGLERRCELALIPGPVAARLLRSGRNVLAVEVHNASLASPDFRFALRLVSGRLREELGPNLIADGAFEEAEARSPAWPAGSASPLWRMEGNHIASGRRSHGAITGEGSLALIALGSGDNKVNRVETSDEGLAPLEPGREYTVRFRARWIIGSPVLLTHGAYESSRPPSYAASHRLAVPPALGTPGALNSVSAREAERAGAARAGGPNPGPGRANLGPVVSEVSHAPAVPAPGEAVVVRARVEDPDGVRSARVVWSLDAPLAPGSAGLAVEAMLGPDREGFYHAALPARSDARRVVYFIQAEDAGGRSGRYPLDHLRRTHPLVLDPEAARPEDARYIIYRHVARDEVPDGAPPGDGGGSPPAYRLLLHDPAEAYLDERRLLSNDFVEATLVVADRLLYPGAEVRFAGSPFARRAWSGSYRLRPPRDRWLPGGFRRLNLEDHQGGGGADARERISSYLLRHGAGPSRLPYPRGRLIELSVNDREERRVKEHVETPDRDFLARWYPGGDDGPFFEMDDRHQVSDLGTRIQSQDARLLYPPHGSTERGEDPEEYRYYFNPRGAGRSDDFSALIELARLLSPEATADGDFDRRLEEVLDLEELCRVLAVRLNTDDRDSWGARRGKNCYLYRPSGAGAGAGRWVLVPWDMELTYGEVDSFLPPAVSAGSDPPYTSRFPEVMRLLNRPRAKRIYYGAVLDLVRGPFAPAFLAPYLERLDAAGMVATEVGKPGGFIERRRELLLERLRGVTQDAVPFRITTNGGGPITLAGRALALEGTAPVEVREVRVLVDGTEPTEPFTASLGARDLLSWSAVGTLAPGRHDVDCLAFDSAGGLFATASVEVTSLVAGAAFTRGDADGSGRLEVIDALWALRHLAGGAPLSCPDALDADDDGAITLADPLRVLGALFAREPPPPAPFPAPGGDPTPDGLECGA
jgi:hypothetical protein